MDFHRETGNPVKDDDCSTTHNLFCYVFLPPEPGLRHGKHCWLPLPKDYKELENIIDLTKNYLTTVSKNIQENSKLNEIKNQLLNKYF